VKNNFYLIFMQPELSKMVAATLSIAERQVARTLDLLEEIWQITEQDM